MALGANYNSITGELDPNGVYMTHSYASTIRYKYKQANMTQKQAVQQLLNEPQLKKTSFNLPTWLKENPKAQEALDTGTKKQSDWKKITRQQELRNTYASKMKKSPPVARNNTYSFGANTQTIDLPLAAESPVKENDFLPPSETPEQIFDFTPINSGRIELNPTMPEQKIIEKIAQASTPAKSDNSKYFVIGGIAIAALVLFLILRRRK